MTDTIALSGIPGIDRLHPETAKMLEAFTAALVAKLVRAQDKYNRSDGWRRDAWEAECKEQLLRHVFKGDPLDVAAYAAFCHARGWTTTPATPPGVDALIRKVTSIAAEWAHTDETRQAYQQRFEDAIKEMRAALTVQAIGTLNHKDTGIRP